LQKAFGKYVLNHGAREVEYLEVHPFDQGLMTEKALSLLKTYKDEAVVLNYTGGTKPMSIGLFAAAQKYGKDVIYVDSQHGKIPKLSADIWSSTPFPTMKIDIFEWFSLMGYDDVEASELSDYSSVDGLAKWLFICRSNQDAFIVNVCRYAQDILNSMDNNPNQERNYLWIKKFESDHLQITPINNGKHVEVVFEGSEIPFRAARFWIEYFSSLWFEYWIALQLQMTGAYDQVLMNVVVKGINSAHTEYDFSEIDVVAIRNGYITFIEAKLGWLDQKALTKMNADRELFGPRYSKKMLLGWVRTKSPANLQRIEHLGIEAVWTPKHIKEKLATMHLKNEQKASL
jgi:hypothetical protein